MANKINASSFNILDTAVEGDTGAEFKSLDDSQNLDKNGFVSVEVGSGDTIVIEGKILSTEATFAVLETFTARTLKQVKLPNLYRARRTVDGGGADSKVNIQTLGSFNGT